MTRQIILDTETTGLSPAQGHRVIEVGCVEMIDRCLTGNHFHYYINPEGKEVDPGAYRVHGINNEFLNDKPTFKDIYKDLIEYIRGAELVIHNAPFDVGFLNSEFRLIKPHHPLTDAICTVFDTLTFARQKHPGQKNNLDALCRRYDIDNSNRDLHGALLDAEILASVYLAMTRKQVTMFAEQDKADISESDSIEVDTVREDRQALPIVEPTRSELQAHEAFLQQLQDKDGESLWHVDPGTSPG